MRVISEFSKSLVSRVPSHLFETAANYSVLREQQTFTPPQALYNKAIYHEAVCELLGFDIQLDYLEFGVYRGETLDRWSKLNINPDSLFYGFDSFEGIPEQWRSRPQGYFDLGGRIPHFEDRRINCVKGWFNKTLPYFFQSTGIPRKDSTVLVHIDADLYSSALFCLTMLHHHIPNYYVMFDEFGAGEGRALRDFISAYGVKFEALIGAKRKKSSALFTQVFGKIIGR